MSTIHLETEISAPINTCFDVSRDIDIHKLSTEGTNEKAIAGVNSYKLPESIQQEIAVEKLQISRYLFIGSLLGGVISYFLFKKPVKRKESSDILHT